MAKLNPKIRPEAGGHRFGPDLQCTECGRYWEQHQQQPSPCSRSVRERLDSYASPESLEAKAEVASEDRKEK